MVKGKIDGYDVNIDMDKINSNPLSTNHKEVPEWTSIIDTKKVFLKVIDPDNWLWIFRKDSYFYITRNDVRILTKDKKIVDDYILKFNKQHEN